MCNVAISNDTMELLYELKDMWGLESIDLVVDRLAKDKLDEFNQPEPTTPTKVYPSWPTTIEQAVDKVTQFDAGGEVTMTDQHTTATEKITITWDDIVDQAGKSDKVIIEYKKYPPLTQVQMKEAIIQLYNNIPRDVWGTEQAVQLFMRQCAFMQIELN